MVYPSLADCILAAGVVLVVFWFRSSMKTFSQQFTQALADQLKLLEAWKISQEKTLSMLEETLKELRTDKTWVDNCKLTHKQIDVEFANFKEHTMGAIGDLRERTKEIEKFIRGDK